MSRIVVFMNMALDRMTTTTGVVIAGHEPLDPAGATTGSPVGGRE